MADINVEPLKNFADTKAEIQLAKANSDIVKVVQNLLKIANYYTGEVDSIVGDGTAKAFAKFKQEHWLEHPDMLGQSAALSLLELLEVHQGSSDKPQSNSGAENNKTGKSMKLPSGDTVFSNERIIDTIPLTWGEVTNGCTRVPENKTIVDNIEKIARVFAEIRNKYDSPLGVTSGYRPPAINRQVGGARASQHITGNALDIYPTDGNLKRLYEICKATSSVVGLGNGIHRGFVHIDARSGGRTYWNYP